ncbi:MAG TPA: SRPBCC domain-containing protein [Anaerolineales bacterium]|nr:SRPBCC domain-containing protein [Anaerolineales bacterium]HRQ91373.1 SRPBCC domain-containing protein [Anaerolineales bacterium]
MLSKHSPQELKIEFEIYIDAAPARVWGLMASTEGMNLWLARNLVFEHKLGGRFEMKGNLPGEGPYRFTGEVTKLEPERELAFTWKSDPENGTPWNTSTLVTLRLQPQGAGTLVSLIHTGFEGLGEAASKEAYEGHIQGWTIADNLNDLKQAAEAN